MSDFSFVIDKIFNILKNDSDLAIEFKTKWGVELNDFRKKISDPLTHGGYISKISSLEKLHIKKNMTILDIGPEMGLEVYILSEFARQLTVCDPDEDNLKLINKIASKYKNEKDENISDFIEFKPLGFNNTEGVNKEEKIRYKNIISVLGHSLPTYYNVTSNRGISSLNRNSYDLIFIHKILTTITRSSSKNPFEIFKNAVDEISELLRVNGVCSWTEPEFVFLQKGILNKIGSIDNIRIKFNEYQPDELPEKYIQMLIEVEKRHP